MGMLPGVGKIKKQLDEVDLDKHRLDAPAGDHLLDDQAEQRKPKVINASRKKRIAAGSGVEVQRSTACSRCIGRWPT